MTETVGFGIDRLLELLGLTGPMILWVTVPLTLLQSLAGVFPFAVLVVLHISVFDTFGGMLVSWAAGTVGAVLVYYAFRRYLYDWFDRKWRGRRASRYAKWPQYIERYGLWSIILLRTIPVVPNNVINLMSAVSPVKPSAFIWGTMLGNLSFIWLFGILGSTFMVPAEEWGRYLTGYAIYVGVLIFAFVGSHRDEIREARKRRKTSV